MIKISIRPKLKDIYLSDSFSEQISFVGLNEESDVHFTMDDINKFDFNTTKPNHIILMKNIRLGVDWGKVNARHGFCVDNKILPNLNINNFCFTTNDLCDFPYIIPSPFGPAIDGTIDKKTIKNETFNNKVFWSGAITHSTRKDFLYFYNTINDERFNVSLFDQRIYKDGLKTETYETYLNNLSKSDVVYILRGDRIWVNTFFDVIRCGCIPIMINSMNDYGWENIFQNVDDYMLRFDLREHSMDYIHQQVLLLLKDKERVLFMKNNIRRFHDMFFKHNVKYGFSEFLLAKLVEIYKNDFDINKIDDKFISTEILNLKGFDKKL